MPNRLKIVYFNYLYDLYEGSLGSTIKAQKLMAELRRQGHNVRVYWLNAKHEENGSEIKKQRLRTLLKKKLSRYVHEANQILSNLRYYFREKEILKKESPDLLILRLQAYFFSAVILAKQKRIPVLLEADCPAAYENRKFFLQYLKLPLINEWIERINFRLADAIFTVSEELKRYITDRGIASERVKVIPNGAECGGVRKEKLEQIRERYALNNKTILGFVGSFHHWHGVCNLTALIEKTVSYDPNVTFLLVGHGGPMASELREFVRTKKMDKNVILTGFVPHSEIPNYIASMDIVLAPYPKLDFFYYSPVKIYEYMAYGKPVISSRIGQIQEIIQHMKTGLLCEPDDLDDFFVNIRLLLEKPELRLQIGECARRMVQSQHTWRHRGKALSDLCKALVHNFEELNDGKNTNNRRSFYF